MSEGLFGQLAPHGGPWSAPCSAGSFAAAARLLPPAESSGAGALGLPPGPNSQATSPALMSGVRSVVSSSPADAVGHACGLSTALLPGPASAATHCTALPCPTLSWQRPGTHVQTACASSCRPAQPAQPAQPASQPASQAPPARPPTRLVVERGSPVCRGAGDRNHHGRPPLPVVRPVELHHLACTCSSGAGGGRAGGGWAGKAQHLGARPLSSAPAAEPARVSCLVLAVTDSR